MISDQFDLTSAAVIMIIEVMLVIQILKSDQLIHYLDTVSVIYSND